jgi:hypothetical protein
MAHTIKGTKAKPTGKVILMAATYSPFWRGEATVTDEGWVSYYQHSTGSSTEQNRRIGEKKMMALLTFIDQKGFYDLPPHLEGDERIDDLPDRCITVNGIGKRHKVRYSGTGKTPERMVFLEVWKAIYEWYRD